MTVSTKWLTWGACPHPAKEPITQNTDSVIAALELHRESSTTKPAAQQAICILHLANQTIRCSYEKMDIPQNLTADAQQQGLHSLWMMNVKESHSTLHDFQIRHISSTTRTAVSAQDECERETLKIALIFRESTFPSGQSNEQIKCAFLDCAKSPRKYTLKRGNSRTRCCFLLIGLWQISHL
jgi:hypothetical protein